MLCNTGFIDVGGTALRNLTGFGPIFDVLIQPECTDLET